jgi:molybdopterin/thiamine biosynthesis adenylyltransferase
MFLTISDNLIAQMVQENNRAEGGLYGRLLDGADVAQVLGLNDGSGSYLGRWFRRIDPAALPQVEDEIFILFAADQPEQLTVQRWRNNDWEAINYSIIRLHTDYTSRLRGLFEADRLAQKRVAVIGLGSGGSVVATQLARCGIGHMRLVDFDRLEVHNIARHVCGLRDVGRYKTRAMRDLLLDISPAIQVETYEIDVLNDADMLATIVTDCDLVIAATDKENSKLAINQACWPRSIPVVYGAAYNRAFGGDIFRTLPPDGPCYNCFQAVVAEYFDPPPAATNDFSIGYQDPSKMTDLIAEPGLGLDVGVIAHLMARMALLTLLRGSSTTLTDLPTNWLLFGNRDEWIFQKPLESLFIDVPKREDCPVCNYESYVHEALHMSVDQASQTAEAILQSLPNRDTPIVPHN